MFKAGTNDNNMNINVYIYVKCLFVSDIIKCLLIVFFGFSDLNYNFVHNFVAGTYRIFFVGKTYQ